MVIGLVFVFGAMVGSFMNVCIYRLPRDESIVFPGSHCAVCKKAVRWYDNIPILSYFILGGKCRDCKAGFSMRYALVEALTGMLFVLFYRFFGFGTLGVIDLALTLALVVESLIDFDHKIIPDTMTLPGIVLGLALSFAFPGLHAVDSRWTALGSSALGVLVGGGFLYLIAVVAEWILKKEAMGGGDVKLLAMIGAFLGVRGVAWTVFIGSVIGSLAAIYFKFKKKEAEIPFGPFLGLAAILYLFFGEKVIQWYLQLRF